MIELDAKQLSALREYADRHLPGLPKLREEIVDHLACEVESRMERGQSFEAARDAVLRDWDPHRLRHTERQIHYLLTVKPKRMRYFAWASLVGLVGFLLWGLLPDSSMGTETACAEPTRSDDYLLFPEETPFDRLIREEAPVEEDVSYGRFAHRLADPPSGAPVREFSARQVSVGYGWALHPIKRKRRLHRGVDILGQLGTPVLATGAGVVVKAEHDEDGYGKHIVIQHDEEHKTLYGHLDEMVVTVGQQVVRGTVIGKLGNTGLSVGPHLHYEVIKGGKPVDPEIYFP
jgi:hypothetical protein